MMTENGEIRDGTKYNEKDKTVTWNVGEMKPGAYVRIFLKVKAAKEGANHIKTAISLSGENVQDQNTGEIDTNVEKGKIETKASCDIEEGYITEGTVLNYTVEIKNTGNVNLNEMEILAKLPEGLSFSQSSYEANGQVQYSSVIEEKVAKIVYTLNVGETVKATFTVVADEIGEQETKNVATKISVKVAEIGEVEVATFEHIIEKENSDPDRPGTYHISGVAWLDENKNGAREDNEARLSGIKVRAINSKINQMVVGEDSGVQEATTGERGEYSLKGLEKGSYIVVFEYDQNQYSLTEYRKEGVEESRNNDVIKGSIKEGQTQKEVGLTDTIEIENRSKGNIDIGLVVADQFDLRLDKYVSKITVQDSKGTKSYEYTEEQLAKVELDRKRINGSNVIIEYTIRVTNEGNVGGYAKKIIDYMPKELSFNSELNSQWYAREGEIVNSSIGKEIIEPGESKEVKLILTKQMTENGTGIVSNKAEIGESWNEKGLVDKDSVAGNRVDGEDDQSKADVLIGIGTGRMILYIGVTMVLLGVIGAGAYYVNKKVLKV